MTDDQMSTALHTPATTLNRAVIFHGYGANPDDHWFGWLAHELDALGIATSIPALPNSLDPRPDEWDRAIRETMGSPDDQTVVVAHSLGSLSVLRYLQSLSKPWRLGTLVLVSGFADRLPGLPELDDFIGEGIELARVHESVRRIIILRSDNDAIVPPELTDHLGEALGTTAEVVPGAGHFLADDGITELPIVRDAIVGDLVGPDGR